MSVLCSLALILKQVPTAEVQTVSWESAYLAGLRLPPFSTPPHRPNSKTGPPGQDVSPEAFLGGPNPRLQEFTAQGTRGEQTSATLRQDKGVYSLPPKVLISSN